MDVGKDGKVISFINMKGGVGKTTLCVSLAYQLSVEFNKKILIIDMDPQFNSTQTIMEQYGLVEDYLNEYRQNKSILKVFERKKSLMREEKHEYTNPEELIIKSEVNPNLDIICGNIDLIFEDSNQDNLSKKRLSIYINHFDLKNEYDFIFIDCPPTISFFTDTSLIASDYYLTPVRIDKFSVLGVLMLDNVIASMKEDPDFIIECLGIVYTIEEDQRKLNDIKQIFEANEIVNSYTIFENTMKKHNHLLSGQRGNIAYNYADTYGNMRLLSAEFLQKIDERKEVYEG